MRNFYPYLVFFLVSQVLLFTGTQAQVAPGGVTNGLKLWLKADAGVTVATGVSQWNDQSGNGNNVSQATAANQPGYNTVTNLVNFNPTLSYDGVDDQLVKTGGMLGTGTYTAGNTFVLGQTNVLTTTAAFSELLGAGTQIGMHFPWSDGNAYFDAPMTSARIAAPWGGTFGVPYLWSGTSASGNQKLYRNYTQVASGTAAVSYTGNNSSLYIGSGSNLNGYHNGLIAEEAFYTAALTAADVQRIQSYYAIKYGITLNQAAAYDYIASDGSTKIWNATTATTGYNKDIAGIFRDDASALNQKQSKSVNSGEVLTIALGAIASNNQANANSFTSNLQGLSWSNNAGSATSTQTTNMPAAAGCYTTRMVRQWKVQAVGGFNQATQVKIDGSGISGYSNIAGDYMLLIDTDGDGNFTTGTIRNVAATSVAAGMVTFNNVIFDTDASGTDVITLVTGIATKAALVAGGASAAPATWCNAFNYYYYQNPSDNSAGVIAINPNGNSWSPTGITIDNTGTLTGGGGAFTNTGSGYYQSTDNTQTIRISKKLNSIQAGGSYMVNGGVLVRVYYDPADITNLTGDAWPGGASMAQQGWFKCTASTPSGTVANMVPGNLANAINVTPVATGTENGINYAEFKLTSFSTIGYYAKTTSSALPLGLRSFSGTCEGDQNVLRWVTANEINTARFEVESSVDGNSYAKVATVPAAGSSSANSYTAHIPQTGIITFYRLKMIDQDEKYTYSQVIPVRYCGNSINGYSVKLFPNPVKGSSLTAEITLPANEQIELQVVSPAGNVLARRRVTGQQGTQHVVIFLPRNMAEGTYYLSMVSMISKQQVAVAPATFQN
jgi:hypothetical protein